MSSPPVAPAAHEGPDSTRPTPPGALQRARARVCALAHA
jgi:hypothetical protein